MNFHVKFNYRKIRYFDAKIQFLLLGTKIQVGGDFGAKIQSFQLSFILYTKILIVAYFGVKIQIPKTIFALKNELLLISKNYI